MQQAPEAHPRGLPDLATCAEEPIHVPGAIQPGGFLVCLTGPESTVVHASANLPQHTGREVHEALGRPLAALLGEQAAGQLLPGLRALADGSEPAYLRTFTLPGPGGMRAYHAIAHRRGEAVLLEMEAAAQQEQVTFHTLYANARSFFANVQAARTPHELCRLAAEEVRRLTGFDRVLVYRFDADWNGQVIAESGNGSYPSLLDHRFPACDIPEQARALYRLNRVRLVADATYQPVPIVPPRFVRTGEPLDLTFAALRSVSPVHVEYLRNMGVQASFSVSILVEGRLWGLISAHHRTPRGVPFEVRGACDFLGQLLSLELGAKQRAGEYEHSLGLRRIQGRILQAMAGKEHFVDGLAQAQDDLLRFADAHGVAVVHEGSCSLLGETPSEDEVRALADWLADRGHADLFATDSLPAEIPDAEPLRATACGVLAIAISKLYRSYVMWFRPEVVRTLKWGGDPNKPVAPPKGDARIHPRKSFETWMETVRGRAEPWKDSELEAARELRNAIVGIVLRSAEELAEVSSELSRANKELETFSYSVSHDLRAPFRHILGYSELLKEELREPSPAVARYLRNIAESAQFAGTLVDNLLAFSQIGRSSLKRADLDVDAMVRDVVAGARMQAKGRNIEWRIEPLGTVRADPVLLRMVWENLVGNAVKYTSTRDLAVIAISATPRADHVEFCVQDNGVGFDMAYKDKLFGVFQRLHRMEEFEGTGIGLANVRRIVGRHGGQTWAQGEVGKGASVFFTLPLLAAEEAP